MELDNPEVRIPMDKIMEVIQRDRSVLESYFGYEGSITAEALGNVAGDHLFDDYPERFGINVYEGYRIRSYLTISCGGADWGCQVAELHEVYPDIMQPERPEYLTNINRVRSSQGLEPIVLD